MFKNICIGDICDMNLYTPQVLCDYDATMIGAYAQVFQLFELLGECKDIIISDAYVNATLSFLTKISKEGCASIFTRRDDKKYKSIMDACDIVLKYLNIKTVYITSDDKHVPMCEYSEVWHTPLSPEQIGILLNHEYRVRIRIFAEPKVLDELGVKCLHACVINPRTGEKLQPLFSADVEYDVKKEAHLVVGWCSMVENYPFHLKVSFQDALDYYFLDFTHEADSLFQQILKEI